MIVSGRIYVFFVLLFCLYITVDEIMFIKVSGCCGAVVSALLYRVLLMFALGWVVQRLVY